MKLKISKAIQAIRSKLLRLLLGKSGYESLIEIKKIKSQIDFMSSIMSEQSKILASLAIVQSDLATAVAESKSPASGSSDYVLLKIPLANDDFLN